MNRIEQIKSLLIEKRAAISINNDLMINGKLQGKLPPFKTSRIMRELGWELNIKLGEWLPTLTTLE